MEGLRNRKMRVTGDREVPRTAAMLRLHGEVLPYHEDRHGLLPTAGQLLPTIDYSAFFGGHRHAGALT